MFASNGIYNDDKGGGVCNGTYKCNNQSLRCSYFACSVACVFALHTITVIYHTTTNVLQNGFKCIVKSGADSNRNNERDISMFTVISLYGVGVSCNLCSYLFIPQYIIILLICTLCIIFSCTMTSVYQILNMKLKR